MLAFRNHSLPITVKECCAMPNTNDAGQNGLIGEIQDNYSLVILANKYKTVRCHSFGEGRR
jgi:hypothetical protein